MSPIRVKAYLPKRNATNYRQVQQIDGKVCQRCNTREIWSNSGTYCYECFLEITEKKPRKHYWTGQEFANLDDRIKREAEVIEQIQYNAEINKKYRK